MTQSNTCHICGGTYVPVRERWKCEYCGAFAPISINNEISTLLSVANQSLRNGDFDGAYDKFNDIATRNQSVSDAFWGLACAEYGIKLEDDYNGKKVPTCYNASYESLYDNPNFKKALSLADLEQKEYYNSIAKVIEGTRKEWIEKASKEKPYDIFLSYKSTDEGKSTEDEQDVYELYNFLQGKGYRVFFSHVSLKDKTGERYEPYIFNALNTAKVMIVYGSKIEYFNATWVRNEWKRFLKRISNKEKQSDSLIVVFKGINPGRLPKPLDKIQSLDRNSLDFMNQLLTKIESVVSRSEKKTGKIARSVINETGQRKSSDLGNFKKRAIKSNESSIGKEKVSINVNKRSIGKFEVKQIAPNDERKILVADSYLKQNRTKNFKDAYKLYLEVLENDEHNPRALIGKLLSENQINDLEILCNDISRVKNINDLIECVNYCDENESCIILHGFSLYIASLIGKDNEKAKNVFYLCYDYDSPESLSIYNAVLDNSIRYLTQKETVLLELVDVSFDYLYSSPKLYAETLLKFIRRLIDLSKGNVAKKYLERYCNTVGRDYNSAYLSLEIDFNSKGKEETILNIAVTNSLSAFDTAIESISEADAEKLLSDIAGFSLKLLQEALYDSATKLIGYYAEIDFKNRDAHIDKLVDMIVESHNPSYAPICEIIERTFDKKNLRKYLDVLTRIADSFISDSHFDLAKIYYEKVLEYDIKNENAILGKWKCEIRNLNLSFSLYRTKDFTAFEYLLAINLKNKKLVAETVDRYCGYYYEFIKWAFNSSPQSITSDSLEAFEKFLSYYPEEYDKLMVSRMKEMAMLLSSKRFSESEQYYDKKLKGDANKINEVTFSYAERYLATISSYEEDNHMIYWRLLKVKLKCVDDIELSKRKEPIEQFVEYHNAINAAYNDQGALQSYIQVKNDQEENLKKKKRANFFIVILYIFLALLSLYFIASLTYYFKGLRQESEIIKDDMVSLIEKGRYEAVNDLYSSLSFEYRIQGNLWRTKALSSILMKYEENNNAFYNARNKIQNACIISTIKNEETLHYNEPRYRFDHFESEITDIDFDNYKITITYNAVYKHEGYYLKVNSNLDDLNFFKISYEDESGKKETDILNSFDKKLEVGSVCEIELVKGLSNISLVNVELNGETINLSTGSYSFVLNEDTQITFTINENND